MYPRLMENYKRVTNFFFPPPLHELLFCLSLLGSYQTLYGLLKHLVLQSRAPETRPFSLSWLLSLARTDANAHHRMVVEASRLAFLLEKSPEEKKDKKKLRLAALSLSVAQAAAQCELWSQCDQWLTNTIRCDKEQKYKPELMALLGLIQKSKSKEGDEHELYIKVALSSH